MYAIGVRYISIFAVLSYLMCSALAQSTFTITGAHPYNYSMGGVFVSPYQATITTGVDTYSGLVICDDFTDEVTIPETWQADSSTVGASGAANGMFESDSYSYTLLGNTFSYSGAQGYDAVAWLANQLITTGNYADQIQAAELSFAMWTIFDPGAINYVTGVGALTQSQVENQVVADIRSAFSDGTYTGPTVTVWTPTSWVGDPSRPQEFLTVQTPEAPVLANLAVDLGALLGAIFVLHRRLVIRSRQVASRDEIVTTES